MSDAEFVLAEIDRRRKRSLVGRVVLGALSVTQFALALPWLFGSQGFWTTGEATSEHLTRDGALGVVFAVAGIVVALDVARAFFALPLVFVVMCIQTFFGVFDHHHENTFATFEIVHLIGAAIGVGIAVFVYPGRRSRRASGLRVLK